MSTDESLTQLLVDFQDVYNQGIAVSFLAEAVIVSLFALVLARENSLTSARLRL